ncbi:MAG TPA: threonine synthase [Candidatus Sulfotelmatobacter sp.]|nr:threonine synthase [Candidatus Sulfotelmatobacter sp.]
MEYVCTNCAKKRPVDPALWRCPDCGAIFNLAERRAFSVEAIEKGRSSIWRYPRSIAVPEGAVPVSMGEGMTPLVPAAFGGKAIHFKLEYLAPSGSFKDRGTSVVVTALRALGVTRAADDSSGNAGASFAAYAAHAGLRAEVFAPAHASPAKLAQIEVFGATLHRIEGPRAKTTEALEAAAQGGLVYASHAWLPFTLEGTKTVAYEIWEQLDRRASPDGAPDVFVCPIGQGSLFLGAYRGFKDLLAAGLIRKLPRFIGVQSTGCPPIVEAARQGLDRAAQIEPQPSVAEGIMLVRPLRDREILQAIRETGGCAVAVPDAETLQARKELARIGLYVEPTSAVVGAALRKLSLEGTIVAALTGSGLKASA